MLSRLLVALSFLLAACNEQYCSRHTDCGANQMCSIEGKCVMATGETSNDGGTTDGTTADAASPPDAAVDAPVDGEAP